MNQKRLQDEMNLHHVQNDKEPLQVLNFNLLVFAWYAVIQERWQYVQNRVEISSQLHTISSSSLMNAVDQDLLLGSSVQEGRATNVLQGDVEIRRRLSFHSIKLKCHYRRYRSHRHTAFNLWFSLALCSLRRVAETAVTSLSQCTEENVIFKLIDGKLQSLFS